MNGDTHGVGSVAGWAIATHFLQPSPDMAAIGLAVAVLAGSFPDSVEVHLPWVRLKSFEGHRGVSHWLLTAAVIAWLLYRGINYDVAMYWIAGHLSHLVLDLPTGGGVYLFGPLPIRIGTYAARNGGALERLLSRGLWLVPLVAVLLG